MVIPSISGYSIVTSIFLFVHFVFGTIIVGFVMSIVSIVYVSDIVYPFPAVSFTCVLTSYCVPNSNPLNICDVFSSVIHSPHSVSPCFFIEYCLLVLFIPLSPSVCVKFTTIVFVVPVAVGAVFVGYVLSM